MINRKVILVFLIMVVSYAETIAQFSWQGVVGTNFSQQLVDRKGNPAGAALKDKDQFHPSFGAQIEFGANYQFSKFKLGTGLGLIYMRFFADKRSFYSDTWPGQKGTGSRWDNFIIESYVSVGYEFSDKLPSLEFRILNGIVGQEPYSTFAGVEIPYSLGVGLGAKHKFNEKYFTRLGYRFYGLENNWKPEKGSYIYQSIWSLDMGYEF